MKNPMLENRIICCDCLKGMAGLPNECIPFTLTSPPYEGIRTYDGLSKWDFMAVARELYRITMQGGVVVWVVQEQIIDGSESGESSRQRLAFANIGFRLHHTMVMGKLGGHQHSQGRYGRPLEYAFILTKGKPRYFCPLRDKQNREAGRIRRWKSRKPDGSADRRRKPRMTHPFGIRSQVWSYPTGLYNTTKDAYALNQTALMPEQMAEDHILSWSRVSDLVFDPFAGAGTTLKMALLNHRRYLGFEINPKYVEIARRRLRDAEAKLAADLEEIQP
ncbi:MAG TPA: site-specific DNA-methyltransferase [Gemmataceae bacterium]|jgi:site-specific DNA-methyltransferase (adenine-specific)